MQAPIKEVVFEEKPTGNKLDTSKEDKNMDLFRQTKEKFRQTRRMDAMENNIFRVSHQNNNHNNNDMNDLDDLIK